MTTKANTAERRAVVAEAREREAAAKLRTRAIEQAERMFKEGRRVGSPRPRAWMGSYDSARITRQRAGSPVGSGTADMHLDSWTLQRLRDDSKHLGRNNPLARSLITRLCDSICGPDGPGLQVMSPDTAWNRAAEAYFWKWADNDVAIGFDARKRVTLMRALPIIIRSCLIDGDIAIVATDKGQFRFVESDRIAGDKGNIKRGVEFDAAGVPVAYHVLIVDSNGKSNRVRINASAVEFFICPLNELPNQTRGEPALAATLPLFEQLHDYIDSTVMAARLAAYQALVIKTAAPGQFGQTLIDQTLAADGGVANPSPNGAAQETLWQPGSVMNLAPGEDVTQVSPEHPTTQFDAFVRMLIRYISADIGLPLELSMLDATQTNYHGFKSAVGNAYRGFGKWQKYLGVLLTRIYVRRIYQAIVDGDLPYVEGWDEVTWLWPPPPVIDPKDEYEAAGLAIEKRLKSRRQVIAELYGGDLDSLYEEIAAEVAKERELGISPTVTPGSEQKQGVSVGKV